MKHHKRWHVYENQIKELIQEHSSNNKVAKAILGKDADFKEIDLLRKYVSTIRNFGIRNALSSIDVDHKTAKHLWHEIRDKDGKKLGNAFIKNPDFKEQQEKSFEEILQKTLNSIDKHLENKVEPIEVNNDIIFNSCLFDSLVITDVHIGMNPNPNGFSLYGGKWDENEIEERLKLLCSFIIKNKKSNEIVVFELGDFMDGWDGETVRKGHKLPQNMDNEKAFDVGLSFKIRLTDFLVQNYQINYQ